MSTQPTVRVVDEFYGFDAVVPANEYDVVKSFFVERMTDSGAAATFTSGLFQVATITETPVLTLLDELKDKDQQGISITMAVLLNFARPSYSLLGVVGVPQPNFYAARNIQP